MTTEQEEKQEMQAVLDHVVSYMAQLERDHEDMHFRDGIGSLAEEEQQTGHVVCGWCGYCEGGCDAWTTA